MNKTKTSVSSGHRKYRPYTLEERMRYLAVLKEYNYDYKVTSKVTGINQRTLRQWNDAYRPEIESSTEVQVLAVEAEKDLRAYKMKFLDAHFEKMNVVAQKALDKASTLLDNTDSLRDVAKVLDVFFSYVTRLTDDSQQQSGSSVLNNARIQINNLNNAMQ